MKTHAQAGRVTAAPASRAAAASRPRQSARPQQPQPDGASREETIRQLAYERYLRNGRVDGHALDDWLAAEQSVCSMGGRGDGLDESAKPGP